MAFIQGHLLVASPKLGDPNFFRAVVLLVRHNEEGAFGVVLNRPSNTLLKEVWSNVSETPCTTEAVIHHGGPCPGPLDGNSQGGIPRRKRSASKSLLRCRQGEAGAPGLEADRIGPILRRLLRLEPPDNWKRK